MAARFAQVLHPLVDDKPLAEQRTANLGLFAHVLHIRSWEIDDLPVPDFRIYVAWVTDFNRDAEE